MKAVYDLAKKYYPGRWNRDMIDNLFERGRLTEEEYRDVISEEAEA